MTMVVATPIDVIDEHLSQMAEAVKRMMTHADFYRFTNRIQPKLIVYGSGNQWHVATHDGTCVSRIWSTHTSKEAATAAHSVAVAVCELRRVMEGATNRLHIRFAVEINNRTPMMRPIAWRPAGADSWQRFDSTPWIPQGDVFNAVKVVGGEMEREPVAGAGREMVYWYQR